MTSTPDTTQLRYGETDLWQLHLLDEGTRVRCEHASTFFHYAHSDGARSGTIGEVNVAKGTAELFLCGPTCDDEAPLSLRYLLSRDEVELLLDDGEKRSLRERLGALGISRPDVWGALGLPRGL